MEEKNSKYIGWLDQLKVDEDKKQEVLYYLIEEYTELSVLGNLMRRLIQKKDVYIDTSFTNDTIGGICIDGVINYLNEEERKSIINIIEKYRGKDSIGKIKVEYPDNTYDYADNQDEANDMFLLWVREHPTWRQDSAFNWYDAEDEIIAELDNFENSVEDIFLENGIPQ